MNLHLVFTIIAIVCFLLAAVGADQGKGVAVGLIFTVLLVAF